jgi:hypothetical protein
MHSGDKRLAARAAADEIRSGMIVGLGTGSTVAELIPIVAARLSDGLNIVAVATSEATATAARAAGINIVAFEDIAIIDLTIDGVDEIDGSLRAIKGAGGALLREKIIATASRRMIAIADGSKHSPRSHAWCFTGAAPGRWRAPAFGSGESVGQLCVPRHCRLDAGCRSTVRNPGPARSRAVSHRDRRALHRRCRSREALRM